MSERSAVSPAPTFTAIHGQLPARIIVHAGRYRPAGGKSRRRLAAIAAGEGVRRSIRADARPCRHRPGHRPYCAPCGEGRRWRQSRRRCSRPARTIALHAIFHRRLGLALGRPKRGEIMLPQQQGGCLRHGTIVERLMMPADPPSLQTRSLRTDSAADSDSGVRARKIAHGSRRARVAPSAPRHWPGGASSPRAPRRYRGAVPRYRNALPAPGHARRHRCGRHRLRASAHRR
jgi:hypothetical protein